MVGGRKTTWVNKTMWPLWEWKNVIPLSGSAQRKTSFHKWYLCKIAYILALVSCATTQEIQKICWKVFQNTNTVKALQALNSHIIAQKHCLSLCLHDKWQQEGVSSMREEQAFPLKGAASLRTTSDCRRLLLQHVF